MKFITATKTLLSLSIFLISVLTSLQAHSATTRVSKGLNLSLTDSGVLTVKNSYLTNYIARGINQTTGEQGSLRFIKPSDKAVNFDFVDVTEWDGFFPVDLDFKGPARNSADTDIDLSVYPYAGNASWQNSDLVFRGASLVDLVTSYPTNADEAIDTLTLFLMNALTLTQTSLGVIQNIESLKGTSPEALMAKIRPLAEKVVNYQAEMQRAGLLADMASVMLEQINLFATAAGIDAANDPLLESLYHHNVIVIDSLNKLKTILGSTASITAGEQTNIKGTIAAQFKKTLTDVIDGTTEEIMNAAATEFGTVYQESTTASERLQTIAKYIIQPLSKTVVIYQKLLKNELQALKDSGASADQIEIKQNELNTFIYGKALLHLASVLYASPDLLANAKNEPHILVPMMWEIASAVASKVITQDNVEVVVKKSWQRMTGLDGRKSSFHTIRKVVRGGGSIMKAFTVGSEAGNSLIPLLWDLVFAPNRLQTSIVETEFSPYGVLETEIQIYKQELDSSYTLLATASNSGQQNLILPLTDGDNIEVRVGLKRPLQFDPTRAPWEINSGYTPTTLYDVLISDAASYQQNYLCVRRILGNTDFAFYDQAGANWSPITGQCGSGTKLGGDWYNGSLVGGTSYNPDLLPMQYQLNNFYTASQPIATLSHTYQEGDNPISVLVKGLNSNLVNHAITLVPELGNIGFMLDQTPIADNKVSATFDVSQIAASVSDPIVQYSWSWGDGTLTLITQDAVASHEYSQLGQQTVTLNITTQSGAVTTYEQSVNISINSTPTANAGTDQTISSGITVNLSGSGSDSDGTIASYQWSEVGSSILTLSNATSSTVSFIVPTVTSDTSYTLRLTVSDDGGATNSDEVIITVAAIPAPANLVLVAGDGQMEVSWDTVDNATQYNLYWAIESAVSPDTYSILAGGSVQLDVSSPHTQGSLTNDTLHYLVVTATVNGVESAASSEATVTPVAAPLVLTPLNDTGITTCSDAAINGLTCPQIGFEGQDAEFGRDITASDDSDGHAGFSFTKLDSNGNPLSVSATSWDCVQDNVTGLIWEVKTIDGELRDKNWTYTWYNSTSVNDGGLAGTANGGTCVDTTNCDTEKFVAAVNAVGLCGATDWRLPSDEELSSLVDSSIALPDPTIDVGWFPNTIASKYKTSVTVSSDSSIGRAVSFDNGSNGGSLKTVPDNLRLVRDTVATEIVTHNGVTYGTVTSPYTGKVWLDRNLGASQVCTALDDDACFGDYYEWGRNADGHESQTSATTSVQAIDINSAGSAFVINYTDWTAADSDGTLRSANWSKIDGTSVCPVGYRVPVITELIAETTSSSDGMLNNTDAVNNFLKFPSAGHRYSSDGSVGSTYGVVWSNSVSGLNSEGLYFSSSDAATNSYGNGSGSSVRCIKN